MPQFGASLTDNRKTFKVQATDDSKLTVTKAAYLKVENWVPSNFR